MIPVPAPGALALALLLPAAAPAVPPVPAATDTVWGSPRAAELVGRVAEARRSAPGGAPGLDGYRARAEAHVYYLFDPGDLPGAGGTGPRLARADQVSLRIAWGGPGRWEQRIVGRRSRTFLPVDLHYHTDHLAVVMENFGRRIRMGEGTEVRDVPHPAAPDAGGVYEYRLADSLSVGLGGETRWVYRVEFRPRRPDTPAAAGSLFLDGTRPAVARMRFTFTPEAYRDPKIEEITVDLRSALVEGRYWLPAEQETTIRRRLRWLDFPAGGTIHTRTRIQGYELNPEPPPRPTGGGRITARPDSVLREYADWERPLLEDHADARPPEELDAGEVRARAREIMAGRRLGGAEPLRVHVPDGSHLLRLRRAEGLLVGVGGAFDGPSGSWRLWAGHPFGRERPEARLRWSSPGAGGGDGAGPAVGAEACLRCLRDVGPFPAAAGAVSSAWALLEGEDFTDPYFESSLGLRVRWPWGGEAGNGRASVGLEFVEVTRASLEDGPWEAGEARPVRPADGGSGLVARAGLARPLGRALGTRWRLGVEAEASSRELGDFGYSRLLARLDGEGRTSDGSVTWRADAAVGAAAGALPAHRLFLLGGRGTLPGHPFREWGGSRMALARTEVTAGLLPPWLSVRGSAAAGWVEPGEAGRRAARRFDVRSSGGLRASAGPGVALLWELLRVDLLRGLGEEGRWEVQVSVDPGFWPIL